MRFLMLVLLVVLSSVCYSQKARVTANDLGQLSNSTWTGELSYLDYSSNTKVSIRCNLLVTQSENDKTSWIFEYSYPDEPKANSKDTIKLTADGTTFDGETVIERSELDSGVLRIVTEKTGKDNDRVALLRHTYLIGPSVFSIRKEVRPEGATEFFERHRYSWKR
jgi:hypothetical protein